MSVKCSHHISDMCSFQLDPDAIIDSSGKNKKEVAYDSLHRNMLSMQLAVNNILDTDLSKIDSGTRPPGVRQVSVDYTNDK